MHLKKVDGSSDKGWYAGPWNSDLPIPVGYANVGIDEPHVHRDMFEVYLVARGTSVVRVEQESIRLCAGDVVIVEPGEAHTFLENSLDYLHFVVHAPRKGHGLRAGDKDPVTRAQLGL